MAAIILRMVVTGVVLYTVVLALMFFLQERLIFFPSKLPQSHVFKFRAAFTEHFVDVGDANINILAFEKEAAKGVILYFHGNAGDLDSWGEVYRDFEKYPYHLLVVDYRGYGKSTGKISSEAQLQSDAEKIYDFAKAKYGAGNVIIYGRSIGTGIASWLAAQHPPSLLVLETAYVSLPAMVGEIYPFAPKFLVRYKLDNKRWTNDSSYPVHLIHGTRDEIVPYSHSVRLQKSNSKLQLHTIENGQHNNLSAYPEYANALKEVFSSLEE